VTPSKPYVVRAIYDWIIDNNCTPHVLVDAGVDGVVVPDDYVADGQIVLNISPTAVVSLNLGNDAIAFSGRFGGVPLDVFLPLDSLLGIYARENGQGMIFDDDELDGPSPPPNEPDPISPSKAKKPSLTLVK
jgi:stringent starvation protein B